jgi:hypothetical protein
MSLPFGSATGICGAGDTESHSDAARLRGCAGASGIAVSFREAWMGSQADGSGSRLGSTVGDPCRQREYLPGDTALSTTYGNISVLNIAPVEKSAQLNAAVNVHDCGSAS